MRPLVLSAVLASALGVAQDARAQTPDEQSTTPTDPAMDGSTFTVRLRDNQARVDELADKIRRLRIQLALISGAVPNAPGAAQVEIVIDNEMTGAFHLVHARIAVDDVVQLDKQENEAGELGRQKQLPVFVGATMPGNHAVRAVMTYQGEGFGVFTYLRGYKFELTSSYVFAAPEGKGTRVVGTAYEGGDETTPMQQRPRMTWSMAASPSPNIRPK